MVRLNRAPVSNEVLKVKLPRPVERPLSNGLRLVILESHRAPTIALTISGAFVQLRDPARLPGVAEATAAMMMLGTTTKNARQISEALADIGATVTFGGGGRWRRTRRRRRRAAGGDFSITVNSLTENFDAALAIMSDVLLHRILPGRRIRKVEDAAAQRQLEQARTQPNTLSSEAADEACCIPTMRGSYTRLTLESLNKITRENLVEHYKKYYVPSGELAGIVGDITPRDAVAKLEKALGAWKGGPVANDHAADGAAHRGEEGLPDFAAGLGADRA